MKTMKRQTLKYIADARYSLESVNDNLPEDVKDLLEKAFDACIQLHEAAKKTYDEQESQ